MKFLSIALLFIPSALAHIPTVPCIAPPARPAANAPNAGAELTMAWFRPDLYHRVLTYSGTFVRPRTTPDAPLGAYEYIEHLFPQSEKKPLRLWIQVSEHDNGSTTTDGSRRNPVIANSRLAKVFKEKGYPYQFVFSKGAGHTQRKVIDNTLPQALNIRGWTTRRGGTKR